ncbi:MAG: SIR2 family NAD-dependent protein deacylase [Methylocystis sp.]|uniref:SIR2 family NAD-dependent protein deacylase n=1 Tax=Methylocystis sp. TaxID=1911079 RepID=UPI003DA54628
MIGEILTAFRRGDVVPYLGPGVTGLAGDAAPPSRPEALVAELVAGATVPHKIRNNLTAAAQYIENFKHRKTLTCLMAKAFGQSCEPTPLHQWLAAQPQTRLIVQAWYDDLLIKAFEGQSDWGVVQGVTQSEHFGDWVNWIRPDGSVAPARAFLRDGSGAKAPAEAPEETFAWRRLIYQPLGSVWPASNFIVSDSDYVEVLTEIDIQTPIPDTVHSIRKGRSFLFLGCRFTNQLERSFARQIMKRSSDAHWAVIEGELTRNEEKFLREQNITRIDANLAEFAASLAQSDLAAVAA